MKTYFLIDGTNNNKVLKEFSTQKEAMTYVDAKEHLYNWEDNWETFQDFKDNFYIVSSDDMKEAVRLHGIRKRSYWN